VGLNPCCCYVTSSVHCPTFLLHCRLWVREWQSGPYPHRSNRLHNQYCIPLYQPVTAIQRGKSIQTSVSINIFTNQLQCGQPLIAYQIKFLRSLLTIPKNWVWMLPVLISTLCNMSATKFHIPLNLQGFTYAIFLTSVSGQLHAPAALPPGKEPPVPIG
jgi:hypothetical protein